MIIAIYLSAIMESNLFQENVLIFLSIFVMVLFLISLLEMILLFLDIARRLEFSNWRVLF